MKGEGELNIILFGAPGVGKGTQAKIITKELDIPQIATGDILRQAVKDKTSLGEEANKFMKDGKLVPDEIIVGIIKERLKESDCNKGFILDGFPRTIEQAKSLSGILKDLNKELTAVISLEVPDDVLVSRLTGRLVCKSCGASYHKEFNAPQKDGVCDLCQGELYTRKDDTKEVVENRLKVYANQTKPLIDFYKEEGLYKSIDGNRDIEKVKTNILKLIK